MSMAGLFANRPQSAMLVKELEGHSKSNRSQIAVRKILDYNSY